MASESRRYRVLVIAEAANPEWVSVPLVGWSHALALSKVANVHLVTQVRNRAAIERFGWTEGREFTAIDSEAVAHVLHQVASKLRGGAGKGWTVMTAFNAPMYLYFEYLLWRRFQKPLEEGQFDLVHRITPLSPTTPSLLGPRLERLGIPYVVGPLNGGVPWPREFDAARRAENEWLSYVRKAYRLLPGYRSLRKTASAIIAGSSDTLAQEPSWVGTRLAYIPENAIESERFDASLRSAGDPAQPLRVAFVGRLVPYKGAEMLVEAAAPLVRSGRVTLDIIGDGPQASTLRALTREHGCEDGVSLPGWIAHEQLAERLAQAEVFGFPSIREFGGGVVLEAMALGLVPVVVSYGGPKELVTPASGISLPLGDRAAIVRSLREALLRLADDRAQVDRLSQGAQKRVHTLFTWEKKAQQTLRVYDWVTGAGPRPPLQIPFADPAQTERGDRAELLEERD